MLWNLSDTMHFIANSSHDSLNTYVVHVATNSTDKFLFYILAILVSPDGELQYVCMMNLCVL